MSSLFCFPAFLLSCFPALAMSEGLRLTLQVGGSALLVIGVLFFMWKLPASGERFYGWAPVLARLSAQLGLLAVIFSIVLWWLPGPDVWITAILLALDPAALCSGVLVLWIYRRYEGFEETVLMQLTQARVGIGLSIVAVVIGYWFVMTHKEPFTPVGQAPNHKLQITTKSQISNLRFEISGQGSAFSQSHTSLPRQFAQVNQHVLAVPRQRRARLGLGFDALGLRLGDFLRDGSRRAQAHEHDAQPVGEGAVMPGVVLLDRADDQRHAHLHQPQQDGHGL